MRHYLRRGFSARHYTFDEGLNLGMTAMRTQRSTKLALAQKRPQHPTIRDIDVGTPLKHARLTRGVSLRHLADQVGCTEGFLSKVENNKARPSLATLHRLVTALEINVASLFAEKSSQDGPVSIMRRGERFMIKTDAMRRGPGVVLERLVSNSQSRLMQANIHHVAPNGSSDGLIEHEGEEMGYVLEGALELEVGGVKVAVAKGDSFFFNSSLPHGYRNRGSVGAKILWVNTPPSF
jgi:transcriptional regulator with XRE-family HTH domain